MTKKYKTTSTDSATSRGVAGQPSGAPERGLPSGRQSTVVRTPAPDRERLAAVQSRARTGRCWRCRTRRYVPCPCPEICAVAKRNPTPSGVGLIPTLSVLRPFACSSNTSERANGTPVRVQLYQANPVLDFYYLQSDTLNGSLRAGCLRRSCNSVHLRPELGVEPSTTSMGAVFRGDLARARSPGERGIRGT